MRKLMMGAETEYFFAVFLANGQRGDPPVPVQPGGNRSPEKGWRADHAARAGGWHDPEVPKELNR